MDPTPRRRGRRVLRSRSPAVWKTKCVADVYEMCMSVDLDAMKASSARLIATHDRAYLVLLEFGMAGVCANIVVQYLEFKYTLEPLACDHLPQKIEVDILEFLTQLHQTRKSVTYNSEW